jgi:hypothetical protein
MTDGRIHYILIMPLLLIAAIVSLLLGFTIGRTVGPNCEARECIRAGHAWLNGECYYENSLRKVKP